MARSHHRITTWPSLFPFLSLSLSLSAPTVRRGPKCCRLDGQTNGRAKRLAANRHRGCRPQPSLPRSCSWPVNTGERIRLSLHCFRLHWCEGGGSIIKSLAAISILEGREEAQLFGVLMYRYESSERERVLYWFCRCWERWREKI